MKEGQDLLFYATQSVQDLFDHLKSSVTGIPFDQIAALQKQYGLNKIEEKKYSWLPLLQEQLLNPFVYIFGTIIIISLALHEIKNSIIIFLCLAINVIVGFYQEYKAMRHLKLLKKYLHSYSNVIRSGKDATINSQELVPGDILVLSAGDKITADCRFIKTENLLVDESLLTGESTPVHKTNTTLTEKTIDMFTATNVGFSGTHVTSGKGVALVFGTGKQTSFGTIAELTLQAVRVSNTAQSIRTFGFFIIKLIVISLILIFAIHLIFQGQKFNILDLFLFSTALIITTIPEALPAVVTFCLAQGAQKLAKNNVIVKRLSAVEDLGAIELLCSDKTGTLTENKLTVANVYTADSSDTLLYAALCNVTKDEKQPVLSNGFEAALYNALSPEQKTFLKQYSILNDIPFDFERRRNVVLIDKETQYIVYVRGSFDTVIEQCSVTIEQKNNLERWTQTEEQAGKRVLAVAYKNIPKEEKDNPLEDQEKLLQISGLISFQDPLKTSSITALKMAQELGVTIKILSGDSKDVCGAIAQQIGLIQDSKQVMIGVDFELLSLEEKRKCLQEYAIFARITPKQKYEIIRLLEEQYAVGYMGDGINDTPALKAATVSLVVEGAPSLVQEIGDIILLQKNLLIIINGIKEGRKILVNVFKYLRITISSTLGNFYSLSLASFYLPFLPMLPIQLLMANLLSDLPMIAISTDSVEPSALEKPGIYNIKTIFFTTTLFGLVSSIFDCMIFISFKSNQNILHSAWFISSIATQLVSIFVLRTQLSFFRASRPSFIVCMSVCIVLFGAFLLPFSSIGQQYLELVPLTSTQLTRIILVILGYFVTTEIVKRLYYRLASPQTPLKKKIL